MTSKKENNIPADKIDLYDQIIKTNPGIEQKGATIPYTSMNGHMFSFLDKAGSLCLRLPKEVKEDFLKKYKTTLCKSYETVLKEYVLVPEKLFENTKELKKYFDVSFEYVKNLKPKPTKKIIKATK